MKTKTACIIVAGLLVAAMAAFLVVQVSPIMAQEPGGGQGGPGGMGRGGDRMPRGGGGASAMTVMGKFVFVSTGRSLIKVDGESMTIVKTLELASSSKPEDRPREGEKGE